jgi:hypothetical protein
MVEEAVKVSFGGLNAGEYKGASLIIFDRPALLLAE